MNEGWFLNKFLDIAGRKYPESYFLDQLVLPWSAQDDYDGPLKFTCDLVEIDGGGRLHLWQFASVRGPDLLGGTLIGRMFACSRVLRLTAAEALKTRIEKGARRRRYDTADERFRHVLRRIRHQFDSWNIVACGGKGCELAGHDGNLLWQLYAPLGRDVDQVRDVNTWHFYQTGTGFDLRSIWDLSVSGGLSLAEKLAIYDGRMDLAPAPGDDFDIGAKRDLHLKRKKGFHAQGHEAYFADRAQILAR
ncbi:MAG: hypothetical protein ACM31L_05425 [Actinomycetota bacterium]